MRKIETISLISTLIVFSLRFVEFPPHHMLLLISVIWLAVVQIIFHKKNYYIDNNRIYAVTLINSILFAISLVSLYFIFYLYRYKILIIIITCLAILTVIITIKTKKTVYKNVLYKNIPLILLAATIFLSNPSNRLFRKSMKFLHPSNERILSNLKMFDYKEKFQNSIDSNDCAQADLFAFQAYQAGRNWIEVDTGLSMQKDTLYPKSLIKITGAYEIMYRAKICLAESAIKNKNDILALKYYSQAKEILDVSYNIMKEPEIEQKRNDLLDIIFKLDNKIKEGSS